MTASRTGRNSIAIFLQPSASEFLFDGRDRFFANCFGPRRFRHDQSRFDALVAVVVYNAFDMVSDLVQLYVHATAQPKVLLDGNLNRVG